MFAPIATAHPLLTAHINSHATLCIECALSTKMSNHRALMAIDDPYFSLQKQIVFVIISTLSKNEQKVNVGSY